MFSTTISGPLPASFKRAVNKAMSKNQMPRGVEYVARESDGNNLVVFRESRYGGFRVFDMRTGAFIDTTSGRGAEGIGQVMSDIKTK